MSNKAEVETECPFCEKRFILEVELKNFGRQPIKTNTLEGDLVVGSIIVHTDGASRGNPGPAACGFKIVGSVSDVDDIEFTGCRFLGDTTNNVAEYNGVLLALHRFVTMKRKLVICTDSKLVANQLNEEWKIRDTVLKLLALECWELITVRSAKGLKTEIRWITGENNLAHKVAEDCVNRSIPK